MKFWLSFHTFLCKLYSVKCTDDDDLHGKRYTTMPDEKLLYNDLKYTKKRVKISVGSNVFFSSFLVSGAKIPITPVTHHPKSNFDANFHACLCFLSTIQIPNTKYSTCVAGYAQYTQTFI